MKIRLSKSQWQQVGKKAGWLKLAHHEKEYPQHILNMSVMDLLDKLEASNKSSDISLYHNIENYLDTIKSKGKSDEDNIK